MIDTSPTDHTVLFLNVEINIPCLETLVVSWLFLLNNSFLVLLPFFKPNIFTGWLCIRNVQDQLT